MPKPPPHRPLARIFESDARLADWTARHREEAALTRLVRKHLPRPIAERVRVIGARDGVLELGTTVGAIAAALRQRTPDLRAALARAGSDFTDIRIRVHVGAAPERAQKVDKRQWDSASAAPLFDLSERLPQGPLKAALARWSRRARGR